MEIVGNGAETGLRAGKKSSVLKNLVVGQAKGKLLNDGSCLQFQVKYSYLPTLEFMRLCTRPSYKGLNNIFL